MAASARLSLVSRYSIGPATENASSRPAMHRMCSFGISHFFRTFLRCQNACFCAFIACVSVFNRTCHRKCKLQACNAPNVQFWHKPFFSTFLDFAFSGFRHSNTSADCVFHTQTGRQRANHELRGRHKRSFNFSRNLRRHLDISAKRGFRLILPSKLRQFDFLSDACWLTTSRL